LVQQDARFVRPQFSVDIETPSATNSTKADGGKQRSGTPGSG